MIKNKQFKLSIFLSLVFFIAYELLNSIELKADIGWFLTILWFTTPLVISFIFSHSINKYRFVLTGSLIILFPLIGTLVHYFFNLCKLNSDFSGLNGSYWFFIIIFFMGLPSIILGIVCGLVLDNYRK